MELRRDTATPDSPEALAAEITAIVSRVAELDSELLWEARDAHFVEELEMDSMLIVEILADIEKRYRVEVPDEELPNFTSLRAAIQMISGLLASPRNA